MIEYLRLIKLRIKLRRIEKNHKVFQQSEKYKSLSHNDKEAENQAHYQVDYSPIWEEIEEIKTNNFLRKLRMLDIPYPSKWSKEGKELWNSGDYGAHYWRCAKLS